MQDFMVIAHRGASSYAPENTLAAFDLALQMGIRAIELDVHASRDGHLVVIHDDAVDRTTNGSGLVAHYTLEELRRLDAGSWFAPVFAGERIPTLLEVLQRYRHRCHLHVEIKGQSPHLGEQTMAAIQTGDMLSHVTLTSFRLAPLQDIRAGAPQVPTGWLVADVNDTILTQARQAMLTQLCPRAPLVTPELVQRLHDLGFIVRAWGVSHEDLMRQVIDAGADGMTVNFPDRAVQYLQSRS